MADGNRSSVYERAAYVRFMHVSWYKTEQKSAAVGNESVPKIIINNTANLFFLNYKQHLGNFRP